MVASESGQLTAVALAEALELTIVDDWDTVEEAEDELLATELEPVEEAEPLADELEETSSLAPQTYEALTAGPRAFFM